MPDLVPSRPVAKRPSRWRRWFRAAEFAVQLTVAVLFVIYAIRYCQITTRLKEALAEMDRTDPGWRLQDIEAARAVVPDADNSALLVMRVGKELPDKWLDDAFLESWANLPPVRRMDPAQFARLRQALEKWQRILTEARRLDDMPKGRFPSDYMRKPLFPLVPGLQQARKLCGLLQLGAAAAAETGDGRAALSSCRAALNAGRSIGDEPTAISQLVRIACSMTACKAVNRTLAQTEPEASDLKEMQEALEDENSHPYWLIILRGERAWAEVVLEKEESGELSEWEVMGGSPTWRDRLLSFAYQDKIRADHPQLFAYTARLQAAAEMPPKLRQSTLLQISAQARLNTATMLLATLPIMPQAIVRCQAVIRTHVAALAAERYRRAHGDWPAALDLLAPDFMTAVPEDPYAGEPLLYRRQPDGVVIYSVGDDGNDDGGNVDGMNPVEPGADVGIRLWDPAKRRQPPPPPAALNRKPE